jgi:hypothetical protein
MKPRNVVFAAIGGLITITVIIIVSSWYKVEPSLTIHLRCDDGASGILLVNIIWPNGKRDIAKSFDIKKVCQAKKIEFERYQSEKKLHFAYESDHGETFEVESIYGRDIQSDQKGFYMVLKITKTSPFIENDKI